MRNPIRRPLSGRLRRRPSRHLNDEDDVPFKERETEADCPGDDEKQGTQVAK